MADMIEANDGFDYSIWAARNMDDDESGIMFMDKLDDVGGLDATCGAVGCIAGWAATVALRNGWQPRGPLSEHWHDMTVAQYAGEYLGLDTMQQDRLFLGDAMRAAGLYDNRISLEAVREEATGAEAAKLLRMVADGEVTL